MLFLGKAVFIVTIQSVAAHLHMSCRVGGTLLRVVMDNQWPSVANHEELDERPLDFVREGINIYLEKKKGRE